MNITFADKKLKKFANNNPVAINKMGAIRAKLYQKRLQDMKDAESFSDLENLPGKYHQLKGNRKDQWACNLDQPYRLIFQPGEDPIPKDKHGSQILRELKLVEIIDITNYHKEG